jgi:hypothetical protein
MTNDIFRTVRELIQSNKCVLMGNAVNNEGELYDDSVENLTAILAMQDSYSAMLAALGDIVAASAANCGDSLANAIQAAQTAINKAKGN